MSLRLELELHLDPAGALTGTVSSLGSPGHSFTGVMELMGLLERLLEQGGAADEPTGAPTA